MSDRKYDPTDPLDVAQRLAYNKALADAKAAIQKMNIHGDSDFPCIYKDDAIAAIEALEVKP